MKPESKNNTEPANSRNILLAAVWPHKAQAKMVTTNKMSDVSNDLKIAHDILIKDSPLVGVKHIIFRFHDGSLSTCYTVPVNHLYEYLSTPARNTYP